MDLYTIVKEKRYDEIEKIKIMYYINTGLYAACEIGDLDLVKYFIKNGAWDINNGLYYACVVSKNPNKEVINFLITFDKKLIIPGEGGTVDINKYSGVRFFLKNN
jgi:hypothetical protein